MVFASLGIALATWLYGVRQPQSHDEFSYLLAADTYSRFRLTNPPHPHWEFFETFHVIHQPTYMSKYPPGQGLVLALGIVTGGHPIVGVWLCSLIMVASITWMLQACFSPRWALFGGLVAASRFAMVGYWAQSYWGQTLAVVGGALLFGGLVRIVQSPSRRAAIIMAVGISALAVSRPYEGFVLCVVPAIVLVGLWCKSDRERRRRLIAKVVIPASAVLVVWAGLFMWNNYRVTGQPLRLPYLVHTERYEAPPFFIFQRPQSLQYSHKDLKAFWEGWALQKYSEQMTLSGYLGSKIAASGVTWYYILGPILSIPVLFSLVSWRKWWAKVAFTGVALVSFAILLVTWSLPHYATPMVPLLVILVVEGCRRLTALTSRRSAVMGRWAPYLLLILMMALTWLDGKRQGVLAEQTDFTRNRQIIIDQLMSMPGRHVVLVRSGPRYNLHCDWVYNSASIDEQKIIWARDMGDSKNQDLMAYFAGRQFHVLDVNATRDLPALSEYLPKSAAPMRSE